MRMSIGWEFYPPGLERTLLWVKERYGDVPLYVTENGGPFDDPAAGERPRRGPAARRDLPRQPARLPRGASTKGVDLRGYFAWSLMDNLEWSAGFSQRFGLVHVDFATQQRTIKASGEFYREVIRHERGGAGRLKPRTRASVRWRTVRRAAAATRMPSGGPPGERRRAMPPARHRGTTGPAERSGDPIAPSRSAPQHEVDRAPARAQALHDHAVAREPRGRARPRRPRASCPPRARTPACRARCARSPCPPTCAACRR